MKIKNVSGTFAYCFKAGGKLVGILPGAIVEVPRDQVDSVKRLVDNYAQSPETAVFVEVDESARVSPPVPGLEETADEAEARKRLEDKQQAQDEKRKKAEALAAQKIQEDARLASEAAKKDAPPNALLTGADGKPIPRVK